MTITLQATEDNAFNRLAILWVYPALQAYNYYFDLEFARVFISFFVFFCSVILVVAVVITFRQNRIRALRLLCIAGFGMMSSIWIMTAEGIQQFLGIDSYLLSTFEFVSLAVQDIPLGFYMLIDETRKPIRRCLKIMLAVDISTVVFICFMNYLNILHFPIFITGILGLIIINGAVFILSIWKLDLSVTSRYLSLLGVIVICLTGVFDSVRFDLYRLIATPLFNRTQKTFPLGVAIFFVLLLFSAVAKEHEQQEQERINAAKLMTSQMQPHFLYNVLASIQEIIFIDQEYAAKVVGDFAVYLRGAVRAMSNTQLISFEDELKNIQAYVEIEKVRFDDRLNVFYEIEATNFAVPPLSIQPLVENAIRHGVYDRGETGGSVIVRCYEEKNAWIVQVEDTGTGFDVNHTLSAIQAENAKSAGLKNLISRLYDMIRATVEFESHLNVGTTVTVTIPKKGNGK